MYCTLTVQYVIRIRIIINNFVFKKLHVFSDHVFQPWIYVATCCFKVHIKHLNPKRRETCVPCVAKILSVERPVFPAWLKSICSPFSLQTKHQKMRKYVKMLDKTWQLGTLLSLSVVAWGHRGRPGTEWPPLLVKDRNRGKPTTNMLLLQPGLCCLLFLSSKYLQALNWTFTSR